MNDDFFWRLLIVVQAIALIVEIAILIQAVL